MLRFLADEDLNNHILRGVWRYNPDVDIVRAQDVGLQGLADPIVLAWAADAGRLLVTHNVNTAIGFAQERIVNGTAMPGVIAISRRVPISRAIQDLLLLAECSLDGEWENQIVFLPLPWKTRLP